jgi:demethoxyubiquinone hydroxylase (CLK1/Coq7/Cat5 family)
VGNSPGATLKRLPSSDDLGHGISWGTACGAGQVSVSFLISGLSQGSLSGGLVFAILALPVAAFIWTMGLILVGIPGLLLLDRLKLKSRMLAAACMASVSALTYALLRPHAWLIDGPFHTLAADICWLGAIGAIVGGVVQDRLLGGFQVMERDASTAQIIRRILRVNDAGERGGVAMYQTQLAVARWRCPEVASFLERTRDHEADHARRFRALMPSRGAKVCRLPWIWTIGAVAMGAATALFGARAVYLCTEVVERSVHQHLSIQLAFVRDHDAELAALIVSVAADEAEHYEQAVRMRGDRRPPLSGLFDLAITTSTETLMWLSTRGDIARLARRLEWKGAA